MIFDFFRRKKADRKDEELYGGYAPLEEEAPEKSAVDYMAKHTAFPEKNAAETVRMKGTGRRHIVELCEDIIDSSRELENTRNEYRQVATQLNDIAAIEGMPAEDKEAVVDTVRQIQKLDEARSELLVAEKKMSDAQFAQMQEEESSIPSSVQRLKSNETYLDAIKRDMNFLEGEKVEWSILRQECEHEQVILRRIAFFLLVLFSAAVLVLLVIRLYMDYDIQLFLLIAAFITTLIGAYVLLKYQDCTKEIKRCDVNRNQAILLQNRVKTKYVNIKNAVDYTCDKYHVKNSYELTYMYEQFQSTVKEQEKFKQTSDDLNYYNEHLVVLLEKLNLSDTSYWIHCMSALVNEKEMMSQKAGLIERKQRLKKSIEESMASIEEMKQEVTESTRYMGEVSKQVKQILQKLDEINQQP
jgi:hypothetical protein